jgi:hypothetical protein
MNRRVGTTEMMVDAIVIADMLGLKVNNRAAIQLNRDAHIHGVARPYGVVVLLHARGKIYCYGPDWERRKMFFRQLRKGDRG